MKQRQLHFIIVTIILTGLFGCKKYNDLVPEFETVQISNSQTQLIESFSVLTNNDASACNLILDKQEIPEILCSVLTRLKQGSEVVFLVDATSSMSDDIDEVKRNINEILNCIPGGVRLGAATYGDNQADPSNWYDAIDLTDDKELVRVFINAISVFGGGDYPESVFDAIWKTLDEFSWRDCDAPDMIIVMGDAEPKVGSGTNHSAEDVLAKAKSLCDNTLFVPVIVLDL